jgi:small subunit ribosomal protein S21
MSSTIASFLDAIFLAFLPPFVKETLLSGLTQFTDRSKMHCFDMADVKLGSGESFEALLRRFNRQVQQDRILAEVRRRKHFEKPSEERRKKAAAKRRKSFR